MPSVYFFLAIRLLLLRVYRMAHTQNYLHLRAKSIKRGRCGSSYRVSLSTTVESEHTVSHWRDHHGVVPAFEES
jgi:hypothetical protein